MNADRRALRMSAGRSALHAGARRPALRVRAGRDTSHVILSAAKDLLARTRSFASLRMTEAPPYWEENQPLQRFQQGFLAIFLVATGISAQAQMTPVGTWNSVDDKTGEVKAQMRITESGGVLSGRIEKLLRKDADQAAKCTECSDDRKDKPMVGLEIIRGAKKVEGKEVWEDGKILDPENGKSYTLRLTPVEAGKKLEVRGSILGIGRTQTWVRVQ